MLQWTLECMYLFKLWCSLYICSGIGFLDHIVTVLSFFKEPPYCSPREGNGTPLQYSCLENPMGGGAWKAAVHGVAKSRTWLSNFTFTFHFHALEKEMATHSSVLAWRIPGTGEPGELPSMGLHRVGHDWSDLAACCFPWCLPKFTFPPPVQEGNLWLYFSVSPYSLFRLCLMKF